MVKIKAQAENDYIWILGYPPNNPNDYFGGVMFNFNKDVASPEYFNIQCHANQPAILSSNYGNLIVYTDGCRLFNSNHEVVSNGDSLSYGYIWESYCEDFYPGTQNRILLSWPGDTSKAILFHMKVEDDFSTHYLLYSTLEFNKQYPLGRVIKKNEYLLNPGTSSLITATRHGNGRDWWLIFPEDQTNRFFSILVKPSGVSIIDTQSIGTPWGPREWASQSIFSPDGTKYIRFNPWKGLDICDFDRCSGTLSNIIESGPFSDPVEVGGGVAVSGDSRYLYVSNNIKLFQFDLFAEDILGSKIIIGEYDGYQNPFPTTFFQMTLAPDGKIYMFATNGVKSVHVINFPEKKGIECGFVQHGIELPAYVSIGSLNVPYFRLGPSDGSLCDTLGINNLPIADFRYEIDNLDHLLVHFKNLSYFEPENFNWTFGNNEISNLEHPPSVKYESIGIYQVCLTVENEYGNNAFCRNIHLKDSTTSIEHDFDVSSFSIRPNPFNSEITITLETPYSNLTFVLYSILGTPVYTQVLNKSENVTALSAFPAGVYFYSLRQKGSIIYTGKLIKSQ